MNYPINNMYGNPYNYPYQNSFNQPQNTLNNQSQSLIRVNGLEGAKAYQMQPNGISALFDSNEDIFYLKISDGAGFSNIRKFAFTEIFDTVPTQQAGTDFVTREEFEKFRREIADGKQYISNNKQKASTTSKSATNTDD